MRQLETPVVLIAFNRPDTVRKVFEAVAQARPTRLLLIADGPRADRPGETERCDEVRKIVTTVDWPCEVQTNFAQLNMGCRRRIISGLDWVFSQVEEAIIFEDDCLPDPSFFPFCHEMLERYRGDSRIAAISGTNLVEKHMDTPYSYYFSQLGGNWGWATWRTRWTDFDEHLKGWPELRAAGGLSKVFDRPKDIAYWTGKFDSIYAGGEQSAWDYQWFYARLFGNKLSITPSVNLIENIGHAPGATHTVIPDSRLMPKAKTLEFPLKHPNDVVASHSADLRQLDLNFKTPFRQMIRVINYLKDRALAQLSGAKNPR